MINEEWDDDVVSVPQWFHPQSTENIVAIFPKRTLCVCVCVHACIHARRGVLSVCTGMYKTQNKEMHGAYNGQNIFIPFSSCIFLINL